MFIGNKHVKTVSDIGEGKVKVMFKDSNDAVMNKNLYDLIASKEERQGNILDVVNHVLATKYLMDMSEYGLEFYNVENIGIAMRTLAHNLREDKIVKAFNCESSNNISIKELLA